MSVSQKLKSNIAECERGIALADARLKSNAEQIRVREEQRKAWRERRDRANDTWEREKSQRVDAQKAWDRRRDEIAEGKRGEQRHWNNCVATWECDAGRHHDWCRNDFGDGWYHDGKDQNCGVCGKHGCTACKGICKKDDGLRRREAENELGRRPDDYNAPRFTENDPGEVQLDTTPLTIGCCNNMTNVIGSQVTSSTIQQSNNCLTNLQSDYKKAEQEEKAAAEKAAAEKAAAEKAAAEKAAAEKAAAEKAAAEKAAAEKAAAEKAAALEKEALEKAATEKAAVEKAAAEKAAAEKVTSGKVAKSSNLSSETPEFDTSDYIYLGDKPYNRNAVIAIIILLICFCLCISVAFMFF
jgi:membrane-associated HD superfamily phosphohydrolase